MNRFTVERVAPVALVMMTGFAAVLILSGIAATAGLVSDDAVTLWASAIAASDSEMPIGRMVAAYPTIPFLATALVEFLTPRGLPAPTLLAGATLALLAGLWLAAFRRAGLPVVVAAAAALLLALHPSLLRAAIAGPSEMFFAAFLCLLGGALYDLRARSGAPEVMATALALLGLAFSHPMGAAIACAAIPLLVFVIRPELLGGAVPNLVMALVFPTIFCVCAFAYMSWIFPGSGWSFLVAPAQGLATWTAGFAGVFGAGLSGSLVVDAGIAVVAAIVLAAPIIPIATAWAFRRRPLVAPTLVIVAMSVAAVCLAAATGLFGDPSIAAVVPPILAAVMVTRVPVIRERWKVALPLLVVGWFGGFAALVAVDPRGAVNVRTAFAGGDVDQRREAALSLGKATIGRQGVLVDTFNTPAIVLGRGSARGLLSPSHEDFTIGVLFARIDAPFVAVPDPQTSAGADDRLNKVFPTFFRRGGAGYRLIYENANWRLFARS